MFVHVTDGVIDSPPETIRVPDPSAPEDPTRARVRPVSAATPEERLAAGWHDVTVPPQPADTATATFERTITVEDGVPVARWVARLFTAEELAVLAAAAAAQAASDALRLRVKAIVTDLKAEKDRADAILAATNATINASPAAYVKDNARAVKRVADAAIDLARLIG